MVRNTKEAVKQRVAVTPLKLRNRTVPLMKEL